MAQTWPLLDGERVVAELDLGGQRLCLTEQRLLEGSPAGVRAHSLAGIRDPAVGRGRPLARWIAMWLITLPLGLALAWWIWKNGVDTGRHGWLYLPGLALALLFAPLILVERPHHLEWTDGAGRRVRLTLRGRPMYGVPSHAIAFLYDILPLLRDPQARAHAALVETREVRER